MKSLYIAMGLLTLSLLSIGPVHADAPPQVCTWFRADPVAGPWQVTQGSCQVTVTGSHIEATLYDGKSPAFVRIKLSGTIQGDKIAAKIGLEGTDAGLEDFSGDLKKDGLLGTILVLRAGRSTIGIKFGPN